MFNVSIPAMSNEELAYWYARIKPIVTYLGQLHYLKEFSFRELKEVSFLWNVPEDIRDQVQPNELTAMLGENFICLHKYGHYGFFKPTIAEVISQIDKRLLPQVKAFEIITWPGQVYDFEANSLSSIANQQGYHISMVKLYKSKN